MTKQSLIIFVLILLYSCQYNSVKKEYYSSGNLKSLTEYNKKRKLNKITIFYDTTNLIKHKVKFRKDIYDSIVFYYNNGKVYKTGCQDFKERKFGNWKRYGR